MAEPSLTPNVEVNTELCKSNNISWPWGGSGGSSFDIGESTSQIIKKVIVNSGDVVDSLEIFYYVDWNTLESFRAGGTGGARNEFSLGEGEYIKEIFGSFGYYYGETCITQIGFKTNLDQNNPKTFGKGGGEKFNIPIVNGRIVGLFGQYNKYINGIGVSLALN